MAKTATADPLNLGSRRDCIRALKGAGFQFLRSKGSHFTFAAPPPNKTRKITVVASRPGNDADPGMRRDVRRMIDIYGIGGDLGPAAMAKPQRRKDLVKGIIDRTKSVDPRQDGGNQIEIEAPTNGVGHDSRSYFYVCVPGLNMARRDTWAAAVAGNGLHMWCDDLNDAKGLALIRWPGVRNVVALRHEGIDESNMATVAFGKRGTSRSFTEREWETLGRWDLTPPAEVTEIPRRRMVKPTRDQHALDPEAPPVLKIPGGRGTVLDPADVVSGIIAKPFVAWPPSTGVEFAHLILRGQSVANKNARIEAATWVARDVRKVVSAGEEAGTIVRRDPLEGGGYRYWRAGWSPSSAKGIGKCYRLYRWVAVHLVSPHARKADAVRRRVNASAVPPKVAKAAEVLAEAATEVVAPKVTPHNARRLPSDPSARRVHWNLIGMPIVIDTRIGATLEYRPGTYYARATRAKARSGRPPDLEWRAHVEDFAEAAPKTALVRWDGTEYAMAITSNTTLPGGGKKNGRLVRGWESLNWRRSADPSIKRQERDRTEEPFKLDPVPLPPNPVANPGAVRSEHYRANVQRGPAPGDIGPTRWYWRIKARRDEVHMWSGRATVEEITFRLGKLETDRIPEAPPKAPEIVDPVEVLAPHRRGPETDAGVVTAVEGAWSQLAALRDQLDGPGVRFLLGRDLTVNDVLGKVLDVGLAKVKEDLGE